VTPETTEHLDKARDYLTKAGGLVAVMHYHDEAGHAAYLAAFHAAQALISERTGRIARSTIVIAASQLPKQILDRCPEPPASDARSAITVEPAESEAGKVASLQRDLRAR
jgi:hypothetical protein